MTAAVRQLEQVVARNEVPADSVIEKVRCVIETLAAHGPLGLTALARESGIAKTTVHRLCSELVEWGVLDRSAGAFILGRRSLIDLPTVSIAVVTFGLLSFKKIPEPLLILAAGVAGLLLFKG